MRKIIIVGGIVAVAAVAVIWSMSTLAKSKIAGKVEATEASAPMSPHDIMVQQGRDIQIEYWAHPF
jgi:hypothetical protein